MVVVSMGLVLTIGRPATALSPTQTIFLCDKAKPNTDKKVEHFFTKGVLMPLSSYDDDPFVTDVNVECMDATRFNQDQDSHPVLSDDRAFIQDADVIYRQDPVTGDLVPLAWNPWPLPTSNTGGSFQFPDEERFPAFKAEYGPDGRIVRRDGLQVWLPNGLHRDMNTTVKPQTIAE
jgi:hypothetical protein